jgi:hypothetical protein
VLLDRNMSAEVSTEVRKLLSEINIFLIEPRKEATGKWQPPDSGLSGEN